MNIGAAELFVVSIILVLMLGPLLLIGLVVLQGGTRPRSAPTDETLPPPPPPPPKIHP